MKKLKLHPYYDKSIRHFAMVPFTSSSSSSSSSSSFVKREGSSQRLIMRLKQTEVSNN